MISKMTKTEFMNILAQNSSDDSDIGIDSFYEGLLLMARYVGTVPVSVVRDEIADHIGVSTNLLATCTVVKLLAHNITEEDVKELYRLGWFIIEDENSIEELVAYEL